MALWMVIGAGVFLNVPNNAEVPAAIAMSDAMSLLECAKPGTTRLFL